MIYSRRFVSVNVFGKLAGISAVLAPPPVVTFSLLYIIAPSAVYAIAARQYYDINHDAFPSIHIFINVRHDLLAHGVSLHAFHFRYQ